jgi:hypothetical protein
VRCLKEEQALMEAERRADSKLLALVPVLGVDGVREQIGHMREALRDDRESLYILFEQIIRKPDEVCRRYWSSCWRTRTRGSHRTYSPSFLLIICQITSIYSVPFVVHVYRRRSAYYNWDRHLPTRMTTESDLMILTHSLLT